MYILKNALVSITRNKGRNILIGIIVLVISFTAAVSLAIKNSTNKLIESYQSKYEIEATIGINRENMSGEMKFDNSTTDDEKTEKKDEMIDVFNDISNITEDEIKDYADSEYVKKYYYSMSVGVDSSNLDKVSMEKSTDKNKNFDSKNENRMPDGKENFMNTSNGDFTLIGYSSNDAMEEFISGKYSITDGEVSNEEKSCVINSELATSNDISVGDKITLVDPDDEDNTIKLVVTGIYEETSSDTSDMMGMFTNSANTIITTIDSINTLVSGNDDIKVTTTPTFILNTKDNVLDFEEELLSKGMSEYLSVNTNLETIENSTKTISNVATYATTFLIITLIIGAIVLFVVNMINIRERKYEIGVLRTIGMKKSLLSLQFVFEILIVTLVGLLIGTGIGAISSVSISNHLLASEIESSQEEKNNINDNFGGGKHFEKINGVAELNEFESIDAVVDFKVLVELLGIGILLTIISGSASMISIQRFSPLEILKERT